MKKIFDAPGKFLGFQTPLDEVEYVVIPFPYEYTTTFGKGTGKGPEKVLEVSDYLEMYEEESGEEPYLKGIHTAEPIIVDEVKSEGDVDNIVKKISPYIEKGKKIITIGGEHSISYPLFKAFKNFYPSTGVLHLDAHGDLRDQYEGSPYNHACVLRRIASLNPIIASIGVRAISKEEVEFIDSTREKIKIFYAHQIKNKSNWIFEVISHLPDEIYITLDVDVFDPSIIRATGTPEPGGLSWYEVLNLLKRIFSAKKVIGVDIVEICPDPPYEVSTYTVAKLIYKIISYWK